MAYNWKEKSRSWLKRYGVSELVGTATAYLGFIISKYAFPASPIVSAYAGAWSENIGYYSIIIYQELKNLRHGVKDQGLSFKLISGAIIKPLLEFGPAELLDSLLVRPVCMGVGVHLLGDAGLLVGKIMADLVFYVPVIITHELINRDKHE